jgi:hypothetical protein
MRAFKTPRQIYPSPSSFSEVGILTRESFLDSFGNEDFISLLVADEVLTSCRRLPANGAHWDFSGYESTGIWGSVLIARDTFTGYGAPEDF